jgi:imidazolonepropionase-like amidohydrolase
MARTLFRQVMVWDGSGAMPFPGDVLVDGSRIRTVARKTGELSSEGALHIDGREMTLMPGMVEGHAHISFGGAQKNSDLGDIPPEEHTLLTMRNAKTPLDMASPAPIAPRARKSAWTWSSATRLAPTCCRARGCAQQAPS